ncbi:MAG: hypothetical protein Q8O95_04980 [bacterium]|nr:hypothetical protein [bacterium]
MDLRDLVSQMALWQRSNGELSLPVMVDNPEQAYKDILVRELILKGKLFSKRYQSLQRDQQAVSAEMSDLQRQMDELRQQTGQSVHLETGESLNVDCSDSERLKAFWLELDQGQAAVELPPDPLELSYVPALPDLTNITIDLPEPVALPKKQHLYDSSLLAEESDDLLDYL